MTRLALCLCLETEWKWFPLPEIWLVQQSRKNRGGCGIPSNRDKPGKPDQGIGDDRTSAGFDNLEIPESLTESYLLMAQVLDIQGKAEVTYGRIRHIGIRIPSIHFPQLPELAYGNITAEEFCTKLSESAAKNQE